MKDSNVSGEPNGSNAKKESDQCKFLYLKIAIQELHRKFSQLQNHDNKDKETYFLVSKCASAWQRIFDLFYCSLVSLVLVGRFGDNTINKILVVIALLSMVMFYLIAIPRYCWLKRKLLSSSGHHC